MSTSYRVANLSDIALEVPVVNTAGQATEIFVQPRARVRLPAGFTVPQHVLHQNTGKLMLVPDAPVAETKEG